NAAGEQKVTALQGPMAEKISNALQGERQKIQTARELGGLKVAALQQKETQSERTAATTRAGQRSTAQTAKEGRVQKAHEFEVRTSQAAERIKQAGERNAAKTGLKYTPKDL